MAMCPECWNSKPYFAPRCTSCNQEIGFIMQTVFTAVYVTVSLGLFYGLIKLAALAFSG